MFVPSLSWQNVRFYMQIAQKGRFSAGVFQDEEAAAKAHDAAARDAYGEAAHHYVRKHAAPLCLNFPTKAEVTRAVRQVTTVTKRSLLLQFYT